VVLVTLMTGMSASNLCIRVFVRNGAAHNPLGSNGKTEGTQAFVRIRRDDHEPFIQEKPAGMYAGNALRI